MHMQKAMESMATPHLAPIAAPVIPVAHIIIMIILVLATQALMKARRFMCHTHLIITTQPVVQPMRVIIYPLQVVTCTNTEVTQ